jgi:hypothetical protein
VIHIDDPHRAERLRVEAFVERTYRESYGVVLKEHYPTLMSVQDAAGRIYAVVGFRLARESSLFLEQYLDEPVERAVGRAWGCVAPARSMIVEIGNLASDGRGATVLLFFALASHLSGLGCTFACATATRQLRGLFAKAGIRAVELAPADPGRLADRGASWGAYYETEPLVLCGSIDRAWPNLEFLASAGGGGGLRSRLHYAGGPSA